MIPRRQTRQECRDFWLCLTLAITLIVAGLHLINVGFSTIDGRDGLWVAWTGVVFIPGGFVLLTAGSFFGYCARAAYNIWRPRG